MLLVKKREAFSIQREDDGLVGMAMAQFVRADREVGHVRLEHSIPAHFPEHAGVALAALFPGNYFRRTNVAHEVGFVPALLDSLALGEIVRTSVISLTEREGGIVDQ